MTPITPEFITRLFDRHAAALELYAAQWVRAPADVVQEAFLNLARQEREPDQPAAWLYRVVRNAAISAARSESRRVRNEQAAYRDEREWFEQTDADLIDARAAADAVRSLPDDEREVVIARIWGGLNFEEIAEVVEASSSTAHRRYESAIAKLRERLGVSWLTKADSINK
jgi:RNA polymerase sigma-70 factor (ECF subfamily)